MREYRGRTRARESARPDLAVSSADPGLTLAESVAYGRAMKFAGDDWVWCAACRKMHPEPVCTPN